MSFGFLGLGWFSLNLDRGGTNDRGWPVAGTVVFVIPIPLISYFVSVRWW
jgi:hypothetical protein